MVARGLHGVKFIVSDDHAGLRAARKAMFPAVPWQRCQFHLIRNAMAYVPRISMRSEVAQDLRTIFNAVDREDADRRLHMLVEKYQDSAPTLSQWMQDNVPEGLAVFTLAASHRRRMRTSNALELVHKQIKRRTRVASLFPNEASVLRLVSAVLVEIDDEWQSSRVYLNMKAE